jgi:hypothetical protein
MLEYLQKLAQGVHQSFSPEQQNRITQFSPSLPQNLVTTSLQLFFKILFSHCSVVLLRIWHSSASNPKIAERLVSRILGIHSSTKPNVLQYSVNGNQATTRKPSLDPFLGN